MEGFQASECWAVGSGFTPLAASLLSLLLEVLSDLVLCCWSLSLIFESWSLLFVFFAFLNVCSFLPSLLFSSLLLPSFSSCLPHPLLVFLLPPPCWCLYACLLVASANTVVVIEVEAVETLCVRRPLCASWQKILAMPVKIMQHSREHKHSKYSEPIFGWISQNGGPWWIMVDQYST